MSILSTASNFSIHGGRFVARSQTYNYLGVNGLDILRDASFPDAAHDSSARDPPPQCSPGTRKRYINDIVSWAYNSRERQSRLLWLNGPAGVGKSAIAQTCAEILEMQLGAAFFFSRANKRDNPTRFFTSIACQLAARLPPYADHLEVKIRRDPTLVSKSMKTQFRELIVTPLQDLAAKGVLLGLDKVIIIDGLDECHGYNAQREIIHIINTGQHALPFLWAIFSRPEPHIESMILSKPPMHSVRWWRITLSVSEASDEDIRLFLRHEFDKIQQQDIFMPRIQWPSDTDIEVLVQKCAGLFIYAATVVRFFSDPDLPGREQQLESLLTSKPSSSLGLLADLDDFYTLIMQSIPLRILPYTLNLLLLLSSELFTSSPTLIRISNLLGYSSATTQAALYNLRSVICLRLDSGPDSSGSQDMKISFYHYSFVEFLRDYQRSKGFCVFQSDHHLFWAKRCLQILEEFDVGGQSAISLSCWTDESGTPEEKESLKTSLFQEAGCSLLEACARVDLAKHPDIQRQLHTLDYRKIFRATIGLSQLTMFVREESLLDLLKQLPLTSPGQWHRGRLVRERFTFFNWFTEGLLVMRGKLCASEQSPPCVRPAYEVGYGEKCIYLYPERGSLGFLYRACGSLEELQEPYIFSSGEEENEYSQDDIASQ